MVFAPRFSSDDQSIILGLQEIDRIRFRVERMLLMPKHEQWLRREALMRTAYSSTMIEDGTIPESEMEAVARAAPASAIPKTRPEVINYADALEYVDFLSDFTGFDIPYQATIQQIHWQLMRGIHDTHITPGKYRTVPNWIERQGVKVYEPPSYLDVPILMKEFADWLATDDDTHPVLRAGAAACHAIAIHPFVDGNGRVARLFAVLLLQRSGYGFRKLFALDSYYQRNRDAYIEALGESFGERFMPDYDLTPWLVFFTQSLIVQGRNLEAKLTDWRMMVDRTHRTLKDVGLNERQVDGLIYATNIGHITRKDYIEITGVSPLTATRDLAMLAERKLLKPEGSGRSRKYRTVLQASKGKGEGKQDKRLL